MEGRCLRSAEEHRGGPFRFINCGRAAQLKAANKRVRELEKELRRKEKALPEAAAMLILEKKLQALGLDDGDDGAGGESKR